MVDILPEIAEQLKDIACVELQMPDADSVFPLITLSEIDNTAEVVLSGRDRLSAVSVQVDVWDEQSDPRTVIEMSKAVNEKLTACGLIRFFGHLFPEEGGIQRKCMRFRCAVDEVSNMIYKA